MSNFFLKPVPKPTGFWNRLKYKEAEQTKPVSKKRIFWDSRTINKPGPKSKGVLEQALGENRPAFIR
jgi:hypothetical protein